MHGFKRLRLLFILILLLMNVACASIPANQSTPGGLAVVPLPSDWTHAKVFYHNERCLVVSKNQQPYAVIGIPLSAKAGTQYAIVQQDSQTVRIPFQVTPEKYKAQYITLKVSKHPSKKPFDWERYRREQALIQSFYQHWSDNDYFNPRFIMPVKGRISGPFGFKRFFNGEQCNQHSGVDIAAKKDTRVRAPADAVVLNTGKYFFCGNAIFLDHGQHVVSVYCHLHKALVKAGQSVKQGQIIGLVGQSGRATGPHLHWGISLNDTHINPLLFVK